MPKQNKTLAKAVRKANTPEQTAQLRENAAKAREEFLTLHANDEAELTPIQQSFLLEYPRDYNATRAYHRASAISGNGCSMQAASSSAAGLLRRPRIKKAIEEADSKREALSKITPERIIAELVKMGMTSTEDFTIVQEDGSVVTDFRKATKDNMAAISELTTETYKVGKRKVTKVRLKLSDRRGALELLGKTQKMFVDRTALEGPDGKSLTPPNLTVNFVKPPKLQKKEPEDGA